ncbi:MAG: hypothetical protein U1F43_06170 [Myxococcota bacterium]
MSHLGRLLPRACALAAALALAPAARAADPDARHLVGKVLTQPRGIPNHMALDDKKVYWSEESSEAKPEPGLYAMAVDGTGGIDALYEGADVQALALGDTSVLFAVGGKLAGRVYVVAKGDTKATTLINGKSADPAYDRVDAIAVGGSDAFAAYSPIGCKDGGGAIVRASLLPDTSPEVFAHACPDGLVVTADAVIWVEHHAKDASGARRPESLMRMARDAKPLSPPTELGTWSIYGTPVVVRDTLYFVVEDDLLALPTQGGAARTVGHPFRRKLLAVGDQVFGIDLIGGAIGAIDPDGKLVDIGKLGVTPHTIVLHTVGGPAGLFFGAGDMGRSGVIGRAELSE